MGLKSSAAATAAFAGVNGATYAASPDAAPLVLGVTMVLYLVFICFICFMAIMGAAGFMFGNFEDEDDRQNFMRQVNDPEARARRSKKGGLR